MVYNSPRYELYRLRAMKRVYRKFGVNKLELTFLLAVAGFMYERQRAIASAKVVIEQISGNPSIRGRNHQYCYHCLNKKLLGSYEYVSSPGSFCIGLSDYGAEVIRYFFTCMSELQRDGEHHKQFEINVVTPARMVHYRIAA